MSDEQPDGSAAATPSSTPGWTQLQRVAELIAHELRTPLAVVRLAASTIRGNLEELDDDEVRDLATVIERHSRLASQLLQRLTLARQVTDGDVDLDLERIDAGRLVREAVDDLQEVLLQQHPTGVSGDATLPVVGDPVALREIVFSMLANAAQFSAADTPIEVRTEGNAEHVRVVVRDHGPGVPPEDTETIFGEYVHGDTGDTGVGLGLFIARGLARAHGGDLAVGTNGADGAEFVLTLPVAGPGSGGGATR